MAKDKTRRNLFATLRDRLIPGDFNPTTAINLGLGGMSLHENQDGVVASYDVPLRTDDNTSSRISNRNFNTIHRLLEAYGDAIAGHREVSRSQKVQQHINAFPGSFYSFVETFSDTKFTEDSNNETSFNGTWSAPTTNPPEDPARPSAAGFTITGSLTHNAYEGSISHRPDSSETASAGTYRTKDLLSTGLTQGTIREDYWLPNHFEGIATTDLYAPVTYSESTIENLYNTGVMLIVTAHANNAFWDGYWDTDDPANTVITADQAHTSKNRIVIYPYETGGGIDISKKLNYFPHVPAGIVYAPTQSADASDSIWGKIINLEDRRYYPNEGIRYTPTPLVYPHYTTATSVSTTSTNPTITTPLIATITGGTWSTYFPAGFINDVGAGGAMATATYGTATALRVDVSLGPNAKLYSLGIHAIRAIDWINASLGGLHGS